MAKKILLVDGVEYLGRKKGKGKKARWLLGEGDVAESVLSTLVKDGPQDVCVLREATNLRLTPLLRGLSELQRFGLAEVDAQTGTVKATDLGSRTATTLTAAPDKEKDREREREREAEA